MVKYSTKSFHLCLSKVHPTQPFHFYRKNITLSLLNELKQPQTFYNMKTKRNGKKNQNGCIKMSGHRELLNIIAVFIRNGSQKITNTSC